MSQKIVINVKSTITGKEDTLVKNGSFDVSSDGVLAAFNAGITVDTLMFTARFK